MASTQATQSCIGDRLQDDQSVEHPTASILTRFCNHVLQLIFISCLLTHHGRTISAGDVHPQKERYMPDYNYYHNLSQLGVELRRLAARNPDYITLDTHVYTSRKGLPQYLLHLANFTRRRRGTPESLGVSQARPKVLFSYGEHAREFFPVESLLYLLQNITGGLSAPRGRPVEQFTWMVLNRMDLYVIAMANPDGRRHVERTENYCWRGTGIGVDLNRNFDWSFGGPGSSGDPTDEEYRGPFAHSEPECRIFLELTKRYEFDAFMSLHSGIKQIYIPFADSTSKANKAEPVNIVHQLNLGRQMARATQQAFPCGVAYNINDYPADGTVFDFMAGIRNIPFSFAIELWGEEENEKAKCFDLFNPSKEELQSALRAVMPIYQTLFTYLIQWKEQQVRKRFHQDEELQFGLPFGYVLVAVACCLFVIKLCNQCKPFGRLVHQRRRVVSLRLLSSTFIAAHGIKIT